jgi:predicted nuclease with TOPRIM domain
MKKINFYEEECKKLNTLLAGRDKTIKDCWEQISELKKEKAFLLQRNGQLEVELEKRKYRVNQLENEIKALKEQIDNAEMNNCFDEANYIDKLDTANDTIAKFEFMVQRLLRFNVEKAKGE